MDILFKIGGVKHTQFKPHVTTYDEPVSTYTRLVYIRNVCTEKLMTQPRYILFFIYLFYNKKIIDPCGTYIQSQVNTGINIGIIYN